jgi:gas vesicle protein
MKNSKYLLAAIICLIGTCVVAIIFNVVKLSEMPSTFIGAALGAAITGAITLVLLAGQTEAEEVKERNVKVYEDKSQIFRKYIERAWEIWQDRKVNSDEYQELVADYYSKLMIYLSDPDLVEKIRTALIKIGDCIDKVDIDSYDILKENIIEIINTLSKDIGLGGQIGLSKVKELDEKMFPIIFRKKLIESFENVIKTNYSNILNLGEIRETPDHDVLVFSSKKYGLRSGFYIILGNKKSDNKNTPFLLEMHIPAGYKQFDKYRRTAKGLKYIIKVDDQINHPKNVIILNHPFVGESTNEINKIYKDGKVPDFRLNDLDSIKDFQSMYHVIIETLKFRFEHYITDKIVLGRQYSFCDLLNPEFPNIFPEENDIKNSIDNDLEEEI